MPSYRPWLPEDALSGPGAVAPLGDILGNWAAQWLAGSRPRLPAGWLRQERTFPASAPGDAAATTSPFTLTTPPRGENALAAALVGRTMDHPAMRGTGDAALLRDVACAARDDLIQRIEAHFAPAVRLDGTPQGALWSLPVALDDGPGIFSLAVRESLLIAATRLRSGDPRPRSALSARQDALAHQPVMLAAALGRCRLALTELEQLAPGDVIPLATLIDAPLDLVIGTGARAAAAASIALAGTRFEIRIERPRQQW